MEEEAVAAARAGLPVPGTPALPCGAPAFTRLTLAGKGIRLAPSPTSALQCQPVLVGSMEWLATAGADVGGCGSAGAGARVAELREDGCSLLGMAVGGALVGCIALKDSLRPEAVGVVAALLARGMRVHIASGDHAGAVERARRELCAGLAQGSSSSSSSSAAVLAASVPPPMPSPIPPAQALGGLSPEGKVALIARLQQEQPKRCVAMIGDGVNDAAALSRADLGVAMGAGSAEVAMECAGVVIRGEDLGGLEVFFRLAQRVRLHIAANFVWAALYNAVTMPLAAGVLYVSTGVVVIPPGFSGLSELLSSVPVVVGSLLVYGFRV